MPMHWARRTRAPTTTDVPREICARQRGIWGVRLGDGKQVEEDVRGRLSRLGGCECLKSLPNLLGGALFL